VEDDDGRDRDHDHNDENGWENGEQGWGVVRPHTGPRCVLLPHSITY
jgi:hypothetical protein